MTEGGGRWGLTRVAFGCASVADIVERTAALRSGDAVVISSRRIPRRSLAGGSIFWIVRHVLVARQAILDVDIRTDGTGPLAVFRIAPVVVALRPRPYRSHQGWRYLAEPDWPDDMGAGDGDTLPADLQAELGALSLL